MTNAAAELLASKPNVLLDFDGPICSVFGGVGADWVAGELRRRLGLSDIHSLDTRDPFDILRYAAIEGEREAVEAERELTKLEVEAVASATPTPGASELLRLLAGRGQATVIVSNNSAAAIRTYLDVHGLASFVYAVSARTTPDLALLKPSPKLLHRAITLLDSVPNRCVMVGDSVADIQASQMARVSIITYANKLGKRQQFARYDYALMVEHLAELFPRA